ncbi:MAG: helix-turn-helix transcriptional regulator [Clostridiales Family XIII bacterium]|jgi:AraC-like DNA-binding protein|nr:helix-turn-helix transcriptional regulator [Clostridiales Family XIII bacterium]
MKNIRPRQRVDEAGDCPPGVRRLAFRDKFLIERTECGISIRVGRRYYDREIRRRFPEEAAESGRFLAFDDCDSLDPPARLVFSQLRRSLDAGVTSEMYYEAKVLELLFFIGSGAAPPERGGARLPRDDMEAVNAVRGIIDAQFRSCPKIAELAVMASTSPAKLQRDFKAAFGRTIHDYLSETRMERALDLLDQPDKTVAMVARAVGCMKPGRFSEIFKAAYGLTPSEYRRRKNGKIVIHAGELS